MGTRTTKQLLEEVHKDLQQIIHLMKDTSGLIEEPVNQPAPLESPILWLCPMCNAVNRLDAKTCWGCGGGVRP